MRLTLTLALLLFAHSVTASGLQPLPPVLHSATPPPTIAAKSWALTDYETGWVIAAGQPDLKVAPASLTKLMTAYLVFQAIADGDISVDDKVTISKTAWQVIGSRMFVEVGSQVTVGDLLRGLIIQSGNDAAIALAEFVAGDEAAFTKKMNRAAVQLNMLDTNFTGATGLPNPAQYSSAWDMTLLTRELIRKFPMHYRLYSQKTFTHNNITQRNRNRLLWRDPTVDGIKTGHTSTAGYCLIATARRDGMRLIATVIGAADDQTRTELAAALLEYGYENYVGRVAYQADTAVHTLPLWFGTVKRAELQVAENIAVLYPSGTRENLKGVLNLPKSLNAPLSASHTVGSLALQFAGETVRSVELQTATDYPAGSFASRTADWFRRLVD